MNENMPDTHSHFFSHVFPVRYHELECNGDIRAVALLDYLQDTAGMHALLLGVSVSDLRRHGLTWVLSRIHLIVEHFPRAEENVIIRTWPSTREGLFSCREYELASEKGYSVGRATTSWALLDLETRRPVRLDGNLPQYPLFPQRVIEDRFETLPCIPEEAFCGEMTFRVLRSNLDANRHVNNTVYLEWSLESLPDRILEKRLASLEISFRAEAFYGERVISRSAMIDAEGSLCLHQIFNLDNGRELARIRTRWRSAAERGSQ